MTALPNHTDHNTPCRSFPACYVEMPDSAEGRRAAFYLAAEEYVARTLPEDCYLFTWILSPTVVMGRNQVARQEVNLDFCRAEGIDIIRRKSGGGCVYADRGNIMTSLVTGAGAVEPLFIEYARNMAKGLTTLGADVRVSGRNDITMADGQKICGNAFYHLPKRNIVHGTMLYDTDMRLMTGALTPDSTKLQAAGVKSVRSRIGLLKDKLQIDIETLRQELRRMLCNRMVRLDENDLREIEIIETEYYKPDFLFGKTNRTDIVCAQRIKGCGSVELHFTLNEGVVEQVELCGDFFEQGHAASDFARAFVGQPFTADGIKSAIDARHPEQSIRRLSATDLWNLIAEYLPH